MDKDEKKEEEEEEDKHKQKQKHKHQKEQKQQEQQKERRPARTPRSISRRRPCSPALADRPRCSATTSCTSAREDAEGTRSCCGAWKPASRSLRMNERGPGAAPETGVTGDDRATGALRTQRGSSGVNTQPSEK